MFVVQEFRENMKELIVQNLKNLHQSSTKTMLSISEIINLRGALVDSMHVYLQEM